VWRADRAGREAYQGQMWGVSCAAQDAATVVLIARHLTADEARVYTGPWRPIVDSAGPRPHPD
jgi:hypothetical protein